MPLLAQTLYLRVTREAQRRLLCECAYRLLRSCKLRRELCHPFALGVPRVPQPAAARRAARGHATAAQGRSGPAASCDSRTAGRQQRAARAGCQHQHDAEQACATVGSGEIVIEVGGVCRVD